MYSLNKLFLKVSEIQKLEGIPRGNEIQGFLNKYLVLDLDNTLIYTHKNNNLNYDTTISLNNNDVYLCIRPYAIMFLKNCSKYYNLIVWSAGGYKYIEAIIQKLFIDNNIPIFLYLDNYFCDIVTIDSHPNLLEYVILDNLEINNTIFTKTLNKIIKIILEKDFNYCILNYSLLNYCEFFKNLYYDYEIYLNNITIVDNLFINSINNINNSIIVKDYYGDINDNELIIVENLLV